MVGFLVSVSVTAGIPQTYLSTSTSYSPTAWTTQALSLTEETQNVPYVTSSTYQVPVTQQVTTTEYGYGISQVTLQCNQYAYSGWALSPGMNVKVSWSADNTVDVWVFTSSEYDSYVSSGTTNPNVANWGGAPQSSSLSFYVSGADTYYLVLHNPHNGIACLGSSPLAIYSASGQAIYTVQVTTYVTQTQTYTTNRRDSYHPDPHYDNHLI
jgi:hypothetical protein